MVSESAHWRRFLEPVSASLALQWPRNGRHFSGIAGQTTPGAMHRVARKVLEFVPQRPMDLDRKTFSHSLCSAPRGSSAGPGGSTTLITRTVVGNVQSHKAKCLL